MQRQYKVGERVLVYGNIEGVVEGYNGTEGLSVLVSYKGGNHTGRPYKLEDENGQCIDNPSEANCNWHDEKSLSPLNKEHSFKFLF